MANFENRELRFYDSRLYYPYVNDIQLPVGCTMALYEEYNDRIVAIADNILHFLTREGKLLNSIKLESFYSIVDYHKVFQTLFLGSIFLIDKSLSK